MNEEAKAELVKVWRSAIALGAFMTAAVMGIWQDALGLDAYQAFVREHWAAGLHGWLGDALLALVALAAAWQVGRSVVRLRRWLDATSAAERIVERAMGARLDRAAKELAK